MKKIFRTLLAVMVAVVMSFGIVALAACGPNDNGDENNNNNSTNNPGLSTGNETYDSIIGTEFAAATLNSIVTFGEDEANVNAKVNLNGTADVEYAMEGDGYMYFFLRDWKVYGTYANNEITDFTGAELEGFVDVNQVVEAYLEFIAESGVELPKEITDLISLDKAGDLIEDTLGGVNYAILSLADAANAVTTANGTVTVNFNKMAYNMVQDVKAFVNGLTETTTIGDILGNATLKKYVQILTELTTPQEIIDTVKEAAAELSKAMAGTPALYENGESETDETQTSQSTAMIALVLQQINTLFDTVKPDANSSVYDYIVKVLSSQELVDMINTMMQSAGAPAGTGLTKKITEFTLGEIMAMIPTENGEDPLTFTAVKQIMTGAINAYTSGITETVLSVSVEDDVIFSLTDASLVYTYGENGLTSMKLNFDMSIPEVLEMSVDATLTLSKTAYAATEFATLPETLPDIEDFEFAPGNIQVLGYGANQVEVPAGEMVDVRVSVSGEYSSLHIFSEDESVMLYSTQDQGTELTVANYDGLSIGIRNTGDTDAMFTIIVEEAQAEEFDVPVLTVDEGSNFSVAAGTSMSDPGSYAYYKVTIEEAGDYVISLTNLNLTSADTEEISDVSIAVSEQLEEAYGGGYDIDYNYEVRVDNGVYTLDVGVYYIVIYNMDVDWHNITGTGTITISLAQA